jgi:hypothetical protein
MDERNGERAARALSSIRMKRLGDGPKCSTSSSAARSASTGLWMACHFDAAMPTLSLVSSPCTMFHCNACNAPVLCFVLVLVYIFAAGVALLYGGELFEVIRFMEQHPTLEQMDTSSQDYLQQLAAQKLALENTPLVAGVKLFGDGSDLNLTGVIISLDGGIVEKAGDRRFTVKTSAKPSHRKRRDGTRVPTAPKPTQLHALRAAHESNRISGWSELSLPPSLSLSPSLWRRYHHRRHHHRRHRYHHLSHRHRGHHHRCHHHRRYPHFLRRDRSAQGVLRYEAAQAYAPKT